MINTLSKCSFYIKQKLSNIERAEEYMYKDNEELCDYYEPTNRNLYMIIRLVLTFNIAQKKNNFYHNVFFPSDF